LLVPSLLSAQGYLHASGTKIVKGNGQEILLRGIGLGGWLVPEGYMLQTAAFANSPTAIRNKIATLIGDGNAEAFFQLYRSKFIQKKDVDRIGSWGFNSIRLPLHYALLSDQHGVYLEDGFAMVDSLLSWCAANQLYLILDLHCAPGGQNKDNISDYAGYPSLWESAEYQQWTIDLWKTLAQRYATKEWIGGYDLLNETAFDLGSGSPALRTLFINITSAIRQVDANHLIFAEGNWYATDFGGLTPAWDANMAYSFHKYWNSNDPGSIQYLLDMRTNANRPLWLGESGENSNVWFTDCVRLMEANNIGWSWWTIKKVETIAGPLSVVKNAEYDNLLKYWNGQAPQPSVDYAIDALTKLANNFDLDKCVYRPDVIDALFRQTRTTATIPYTTHTVPGVIYAPDYDLGNIQYAYSDVDYQNNGNSGTWNSGGSYRNDGVDIEPCSDASSNGYDVGWIQSGEFLSYTVNVAETGDYALKTRVAANAAGGKLLFRVDGNIVNSYVDVPSTGGWQSWQTIDCGILPMTSGTHKLSCTFFFGGFNVNSFSLVNVTTGVAGKELRPHTLALGQNYPNPFNPSTLIEFTVPNPGNASVKVFDVLGKELATLFDGPAEPGCSYRCVFDAHALPTGLYVARLTFGSDQLVRKLLLVK
ncbi:MAG TPA: cellulase family glycosylhydrolase, partial [Bacteroidota bacterium]